MEFWNDKIVRGSVLKSLRGWTSWGKVVYMVAREYLLGNCRHLLCVDIVSVMIIVSRSLRAKPRTKHLRVYARVQIVRHF